MSGEEELKRRMLDFPILDKYEFATESTLAEILSDVPKEEWGSVLFFFEEEGDYYGGSTVTCRFFTRREETDAEYNARAKLFREEEEKERIRNRERARIKAQNKEAHDRAEFLRLVAKYGR